MRSIVAAIALLLSVASVIADEQAWPHSRWVEPRRVEWTGDHWEWHAERYWCLVHISSVGHERFELWPVTPA